MRTLNPSTAPCLQSPHQTEANLNMAFLKQEHSFFRNDSSPAIPVKHLGSTITSDFLQRRDAVLRPLRVAPAAWNEAVAALVTQVGNEMRPFAARCHGPAWHSRVATALHEMREPMKSDVILSTRAPVLKNEFLTGSVRVFCSTVLEQDLEFMPGPMKYPKFPYFTVEPATQESLYVAGLFLLANPPGVTEDELDEPGTTINMSTYHRTPMISIELELTPIAADTDAAILLNWSFRGRAGAMAKVFVNGQQDVHAFDVMSTADDLVPNFWTFVPWAPGRMIIDLKQVNAGYLWFEHVDVHHVRWLKG